MQELNFNKKSVSLKELFVEDMENGARKFMKHLVNNFMEIERDEFIEMQTTGLNIATKDYRNKTSAQLLNLI